MPSLNQSGTGTIRLNPTNNTIANLNGYTQTGPGNPGIRLVQPTLSGVNLQPAANTAQMTGTLNAVNTGGATTPTAPTGSQTASQTVGNINNVNNNALSFLDQKQTLTDQAFNDAKTQTKTYFDKAYEMFDKSVKLGQGNIDAATANNKLNLRNAVDKVNTGLRGQTTGGMLRLAANGAGFSSAAQMLPKGLAAEGEQDIDAFGNNYRLTEDEIARTQEAFNLDTEKGLEDLNYQFQTAITTITNNYMNAISAIEEARVNAGGAQKVALDTLKENVMNQFYAEIQGLDTRWNETIGSIKPQTQFNIADMSSRGNDIVQNVNSDGYQFNPSFNGGVAPASSTGFQLGNMLRFSRNKDYGLA